VLIVSGNAFLRRVASGAAVRGVEVRCARRASRKALERADVVVAGEDAAEEVLGALERMRVKSGPTVILLCPATEWIFLDALRYGYALLTLPSHPAVLKVLMARALRERAGKRRGRRSRRFS